MRVKGISQRDSMHRLAIEHTLSVSQKKLPRNRYQQRAHSIMHRAFLHPSRNALASNDARRYCHGSLGAYNPLSVKCAGRFGVGDQLVVGITLRDHSSREIAVLSTRCDDYMSPVTRYGEDMPALIYGTRSEREASVVRLIFSAARRGLNAEEIAARLNARDIPSPGGQAWKGRSVRRLLLDHRLRQQSNGHGSKP